VDVRVVVVVDDDLVKKVLIVTTSHDRVDDTKTTGLWLEEFATPYARFLAAGIEVVVASIKGGQVPLDPGSLPKTEEEKQKVATAISVLQASQKLADITNRDQFDAVFFPGGHGTMWDLPGDPDVASIIGSFTDKGKIVSAVCHGPACFANAKRSNGDPVVKGKHVTGFSNTEEVLMKLEKLVPFLLEDKLKDLGATYSSKKQWMEHAVADGTLITGQNPQSSGATADLVIQHLQGGAK